MNKKEVARFAKMEQKIEDGFESINDRLDKLNGQVAKNTSWRNYSKGVAAVLTIVLGALGYVFKKLLEKIGGIF